MNNLNRIPVDWTSAFVAPIFKKGSRTLPSNYCPVSLLELFVLVTVSVLLDWLGNPSLLTILLVEVFGEVFWVSWTKMVVSSKSALSSILREKYIAMYINS